MVTAIHSESHRSWGAPSTCAAHFICFESLSVVVSAVDGVNAIIPIALITTSVTVAKVSIVAACGWEKFWEELVIRDETHCILLMEIG